jgi:hypothetical protein
VVSVPPAAGANPDNDRSTLARTSCTTAALRVEIIGVVQGVGFRPLVLPGLVVFRTGIGGSRIVDLLLGGQLPRIC